MNTKKMIIELENTYKVYIENDINFHDNNRIDELYKLCMDNKKCFTDYKKLRLKLKNRWWLNKLTLFKMDSKFKKVYGWNIKKHQWYKKSVI